MKFKILAILGFALATPAFGAWHPTAIRRAAQAVGCFEQLRDYQTSEKASSLGGYETNSLLRNSTGGVSTGRLIALKALSCGVPIAIAEIMHRKSPSASTERAMAGSALALAGYIGYAVHGNTDVIAELEARAKAFGPFRPLPPEPRR
jgi:hypothetical protein